MNKHLLMLSAVVAVMVAGPALAATCTGASTNTTGTPVNTTLTAPIDTCTDGDITITAPGTVKISTANTAAVTINSANKVVNGNTISNKNAANAVGVLLDASNGTATTYTIATGDFLSNTGTIDLTGSGTQKAGIELKGGTFTSTSHGGITLNAGATSIIKVNGDNSAGVLIDPTGTLNGTLSIASSIAMTPSQASNNTAFSGISDILIGGKVNGDVTILSSSLITATGENSQGIVVTGSINANSPSLGTLTNGGTVSLVGAQLAAGKVGTASTPELGSALLVSGNIAGGIVNSSTGRLASSGLTLSSGAVAAVVSIAPNSSGAAVTIGKDTNDASSASFINRGVIVAQPLSALNTTAVFVSGISSTLTTTLSGPFFTSGTISAIASSTSSLNSSATAIAIGGFSTIPSLVISGESVATGSASGSVNAFLGGQGGGKANAIALLPGANLPEIDITDPTAGGPARIVATATTNNPSTVTGLSAVGIIDLGNTLKLINNAGDITVTVTTLTPPEGTSVTNFARAIDLSAQTTGGVTINDAGSIVGDVLLNGADTAAMPSTVNVGAGTATGAPSAQMTSAQTAQTKTGRQNVDVATTATLTGDMLFGTGSYALYINDFGAMKGAITNFGALDIGVAQHGSLTITNSTNTLFVHNFDTYFASGTTGPFLGIAASESLPNRTTITASNEATIAHGTNLAVTIGSMIPQGTHDYVLIGAPNGFLNVPDFATYSANISSTLPFFFDPTNSILKCANNCVASDKLILELMPKVPGPGTLAHPGLGLTGNALHIFDPAVQALLQDNTLGAAVVNGIQDPSSHVTNTPEQVFSQFAPDVSGDIRAIAITLTDQASGPVAARQRLLRMYANQGGDFTLWGQEFAQYFSDKGVNSGELTHFKDHGFGFAIGADGGDPASGWYGGAFTFYAGDATQTAPENSKTQTQWYMLTGYTDWRGHHLFLDTQASVGIGDFNGKRLLNIAGTSCGVQGHDCSREADSKRKGLLGAIGATTGAIFNYGPLLLMPEIGLDALTMREEGFTEHGGGTGFNLKVEPYYATSLRTFLGVDSRVDVDLGDFTLQPEGRLGYRFDFINDPVKVKGAFAAVPADTFTITGPDPSRGNVVAGATLGASTDTWSMGVNFDWVRGSNGSTTEVGTFSLLGRI